MAHERHDSRQQTLIRNLLDPTSHSPILHMLARLCGKRSPGLWRAYVLRVHLRTWSLRSATVQHKARQPRC